MFWPVDQALDVMSIWTRWTEALPESASSCARLLSFPSLPEIDEQLRGKSYFCVEMVLHGERSEGESLLEPLRLLSPARDTMAVIEVSDILRVHGDPPGPAAAHGDGLCLDSLPDQAIESVLERFQPGSPLVNVEFRKLGGALGRTPTDAGALGRLSAQFATYFVGPVTSAFDATSIQAEIDAMKQVLAPWTAALAFANFSHTQGDLGLSRPRRHSSG